MTLWVSFGIYRGLGANVVGVWYPDVGGHAVMTEKAHVPVLAAVCGGPREGGQEAINRSPLTGRRTVNTNRIGRALFMLPLPQLLSSVF